MMPGDQILSLKYVEMEMILKKLKKSGKLAGSLEGEIEEYERMLQSGSKACQAHVRKVFKWPNYDYAWATLRRIRRGLAGTVDLEDLKPIMGECYEQLPYLRDEEQKGLRKRLEDSIQEINQVLKSGGENTKEIKTEIQAIMVRLDEAQTSFWWKVNDYKMRMTLFSILLLGTLILILMFMENLFVIPLSWRLILILIPMGNLFRIVLLGALGGLLGGLLRSEETKAHLGTFYLRRIRAVLSPLLGASGALGVYLLIKSGIVVLAPSEAKLTENIWYYYGIAFLSGFSERLLIRLAEKGVETFKPVGRIEQ
jgi:hypothetical protein